VRPAERTHFGVQVPCAPDKEKFQPNGKGARRGGSSRAHVEAGHRRVVDLDLEKLFDGVHHDVLRLRGGRKIQDRRTLGLIRRCQQSGILLGGLVEQRAEGTPQGGSLSPLLANVLLDGRDHERERRGHRFGRWADDGNGHVKSRWAGERVKVSRKAFLTGKLRLKVNEAKSSVTRPWNANFLGCSLTVQRQPRLEVAARLVERFKDKVRQRIRRGRERKLERFVQKDLNPGVRGRANYYRKATT
jgi:RNA-directed DNA polymerase